MREISELIEVLEASLEKDTFVKMSLGAYKGGEPELQKILVKRVVIKKEDKLSFVYRYKTKDITKNYSFAQAYQAMESILGFKGFRLVQLNTTSLDGTLQFFKKKAVWKQANPSCDATPSKSHDKIKLRKISAVGKRYLHDLRITDADGKVYKNAQDKYRQINHYIEVLSALLKELPARDKTNIVDMGAGKGYLTFALYDYLNQVLKISADVVGVEFRRNLVDLCNDVAQKSSFEGLSFVQGTIQNYQSPVDIHVLIALHACDTATDEAIFKGIRGEADLIVVAPCCHHQIRKEIEKNKAKNDLDFLLKYGIFMERQAEMVTDGIRALILEYFGYSTRVFEFVSDAHTHKNVLIVAKKKKDVQQDPAILEKITDVKSYFGIKTHFLEELLGIGNA